MFGSLGFRKSSPTVLSVFMVLILLYKNPSYNLSRPWKKYRQPTVMLARSSVPRETQTPVTAIYDT